MKRIVMIEKDCDNWKFSSNINEVNKAVLYSIFFHKNILQALKALKASKAPKSTKSTKR